MFLRIRVTFFLSFFRFRVYGLLGFKFNKLGISNGFGFWVILCFIRFRLFNFYC